MAIKLSLQFLSQIHSTHTQKRLKKSCHKGKQYKPYFDNKRIYNTISPYKGMPSGLYACVRLWRNNSNSSMVFTHPKTYSNIKLIHKYDCKRGPRSGKSTCCEKLKWSSQFYSCKSTLWNNSYGTLKLDTFRTTPIFGNKEGCLQGCQNTREHKIQNI